MWLGVIFAKLSKMFRRGTSLPARPTIPSKDEILEDLQNASQDDVIYEYSEENVANAGVTHSKKAYDDDDYEFDEDITSASYLKIDSFLEKINSLKNNLITLKEQKTNLKNLEDNLLQDMSRIKKELSTKASS